MKKLIGISIVLFFSVSVYAQETSRYFSGNYKYTPSDFIIDANTADGADASQITISGGGGAARDLDRGAWIELHGNDIGGADSDGDVKIYAGTPGYVDIFSTNGDVTIGTYDAGNLYLWANSFRKWAINSTATHTSEFVFGDSLVTGTTATIRGMTNDGADANILYVAGGGAVGTGRGAYLRLDGADYGGAGSGGDALLTTADNGDLTLQSTAGSSIFQFAGEQKFAVAPAGHLYSSLTYGNGVDHDWTATIASNTIDTQDESSLRLSGGGAATAGRGAYIILDGTDIGGDLTLSTGSVGTLSLEAPGLGVIDFSTDSIHRFTIPASGATTANIVYGDTDTPTSMLITGSTIDGNDGNIVTINGGGTAVGSTRGAFIDVEGRDYGGADAGGDITLRTAGTNGDIELFTGGGTGWVIPGSDANLVYTGATAAISRHDTVDGADTRYTNICGGGACDTSRGANVSIAGRDFSGVDSGGQIVLRGAGPTGTIQALGGSTGLGWTVNADGTLDTNLSDAGWRAAGGVDTACTTTCGANKGCIIGFDTITHTFVSCTAGAADTCICTTT